MSLNADNLGLVFRKPDWEFARNFSMKHNALLVNFRTYQLSFRIIIGKKSNVQQLKRILVWRKIVIDSLNTKKK